MDGTKGIGLTGKIKIRLKRTFDRAGNEKLKNNFLQAVPFWIASLATGLVAVFYSKVYLLAESTTSHFFQQTPWLLFLVTPLCFLVSWWLIVRLDPFARGSGIPQVMAAIEMANPR